jgi:hypothetical protein
MAVVNTALFNRKRELKGMSIGFLLDSGAAYRCPAQGHAGVLLDCHDPEAERKADRAALKAVGAPEQVAMQEAMLEAHRSVSHACWLCAVAGHTH